MSSEAGKKRRRGPPGVHRGTPGQGAHPAPGGPPGGPAGGAPGGSLVGAWFLQQQPEAIRHNPMCHRLTERKPLTRHVTAGDSEMRQGALEAYVTARNGRGLRQLPQIAAEGPQRLVAEDLLLGHSQALVQVVVVRVRERLISRTVGTTEATPMQLLAWDPRSMRRCLQRMSLLLSALHQNSVLP